jgi:hypothetical protein
VEEDAVEEGAVEGKLSEDQANASAQTVVIRRPILEVFHVQIPNVLNAEQTCCQRIRRCNPLYAHAAKVLNGGKKK